MPIGPPGKDEVDVLVNCLRLHTAMGEHASVAVLEGLACRKADATARGARRGRPRKAVDASMAAAVTVSLLSEK